MNPVLQVHANSPLVTPSLVQSALASQGSETQGFGSVAYQQIFYTDTVTMLTYTSQSVSLKWGVAFTQEVLIVRAASSTDSIDITGIRETGIWICTPNTIIEESTYHNNYKIMY